jgi:hypothetical protein
MPSYQVTVLEIRWAAMMIVRRVLVVPGRDVGREIEIDAHVQVGRIQVDVRELGVVQPAGPEGVWGPQRRKGVNSVVLVRRKRYLPAGEVLPIYCDIWMEAGRALIEAKNSDRAARWTGSSWKRR